MRLIRRIQRDDRGAQAVEFAIVAPVLLTLLIGLMGFAFLFWARITITQAAREGARLAAICYSDSNCTTNVHTQVETHSSPGLTLTDSNFQKLDYSACATSTASSPGSAKVVLSYNWSFLGVTLTLKGASSTPCGG